MGMLVVIYNVLFRGLNFWTATLVERDHFG